MTRGIENLREDLIAQSRELLLTKGYNSLTIRDVASVCHVAVGTVYNYFQSKDVLVGYIMLEDWIHGLAEMREMSEHAETLEEGVRQVFLPIETFVDTYTPTWVQYSALADALLMLRQRHQQLVDQLSAVLEPLLKRFDRMFDPILPAFLATALLATAIDPNASFDGILPILERMLR